MSDLKDLSLEEMSSLVQKLTRERLELRLKALKFGSALNSVCDTHKLDYSVSNEIMSLITEFYKFFNTLKLLDELIESVREDTKFVCDGVSGHTDVLSSKKETVH